MRILTVGKNDAGQRLDKFLLKTLKTLPPPLLYKSIRKKKIKVNRLRAEPSQILRRGTAFSFSYRRNFLKRRARTVPSFISRPVFPCCTRTGRSCCLKSSPAWRFIPTRSSGPTR